jgi:RNA polymerase subunit RPABC4/transcription elongation factor Spt4
MTDDHDHTRPALAAQRATLAIARAVLADNPDAAIAAAATVPCPVCLALTMTHYWIGVAAVIDGDRTAFVTEQVHRKILATIQTTEADLRAAGN